MTEAIHGLYRLATEHGDLASLPFLQTFIEEQNEEEATVETILERIRPRRRRPQFAPVAGP